MKHARAAQAFVLALGLACRQGFAAPTPGEPVRVSWTVNGVVREALVYAPRATSAEPAPILIAYHGHGGTPESAARSFRYQDLWPEAVVVYPRGLPTPGALTDPMGEKTGWQSRRGEQEDRDLAFFDVMLLDLKREFPGGGPVFAAGHSNGGSFVYLLWAERSAALAAIAPAGAVLAERSAALSPMPVLHVAGRADPLVKFAWQERMMEMVRKIDRCGPGRPWGPWATYYPSDAGTPFVSYIHPGGHEFPPEASEAVVRFFRETSGL